MIVDSLLSDLSHRGVRVTIAGSCIELDAPASTLTDADIRLLREHKDAVVRQLRLAEGLPVDDDADAVLAMDEVDATELSTCPTCCQLCDVQTLDDSWHCSTCSPVDADARRQRTQRLLRAAHEIRYTCFPAFGDRPS